MRKMVLFLFVYCLLFTASASAQQIHYDISKGEYPRTVDQQVYVVGEVVSIANELQHRPAGANAQDALFSKGRQGLKVSSEQIWTFVDNIKGQDLQWNKEYLGKIIRVHGWVFHDAQYVEVDSFSVEGVNYQWSGSESVFVPAKG